MISTTFTSDWGVYQCLLKFGRYSNGRTSIQLIDVNDGCPVATATVNLPDLRMPKGNYVIIKDYGENAGILQSLVNDGIVDRPEYTVDGVCDGVYICKLLAKE